MKKVVGMALALMLSLFSFGTAAVQQSFRKSKSVESMESQGLVDVKKKDPSIHVSLMYARADNFTGTVLYDFQGVAFLHPKAADAVVKAQKRLKQLRPDLSLIIFDATRPMSVQQKMWDKVKNTPQYFYVSNPAKGGGMHNYGMALDISICNHRGDTIAMGTKVDHMSLASHIDKEADLVARHVISKEARKNRELLRDVMQYAGFKPLRTEWWHFNLVSRAACIKYYKVIR